MKTQPSVSAIIIFHQAVAFIEEAIKSVFSQSLDDWELLLVDDGSSDGGSDIARRYSRQYNPKVRYLTHANRQNRGMSASRNLGVHHAAGQYVAFLDADDIWLANKLERQVAILAAQPSAAMVCGPTLWWHSWTKAPKDYALDRRREIAPSYDKIWQPPSLVSLILRDHAKTPATCSVLIRRQTIIDFGGFENEFTDLFEDQAFFFKVYLSQSVFVSGECLDRYRQHSTSHCSLAEQSGHYHPSEPSAAKLAFLDWLSGYLKQQDNNDSEVRSALREAYKPYHQPFIYYLQRPLALTLRLARRIVPHKLRNKLWSRYSRGARI